MKRLIGFSIIGVGLALVSLSLYEFYETKTGTEKALAIAKTVIASQPETQINRQVTHAALEKCNSRAEKPALSA